VRNRRLAWPLAVLFLTAASCGNDASGPLLVTYSGLSAEDPAQVQPGNVRVGELHVRHGCVVVVEEGGSKLPLVAIWPGSAKLTDEGVELDGRLAKFGERSRLHVALAVGDDSVTAQLKKCGSDLVQYYTAIVPQ
jgi:hypothetical protein